MDNKKKQEIMQTMLEIQNKVEEMLDNKTQEMGNIFLYQNLVFAKSGLGVENAYVVEVKNKEEILKLDDKAKSKEKKSITYQIYDEDKNFIATVDAKGKVQFQEEFLEGLKEVDERYFESLELEDAEFKLPKELQENDLVMSQEEIKNYKATKLAEEKKQETEEQKKNKSAQALGLGKKDIQAISEINPREKITDTYNLIDIMPEAGKYETIAVVCTKGDSNNSSSFVFLGVDKNGNREKIESIEPLMGTSGDKDVISINEDGTEVQEKQVKGLMRINARGRDDGIAISVGDYGMMDIDYVSNVMDNERRRATPIRTITSQNQRISTAKVRENAGDHETEMEKEGDIFRKREERGLEEQSLDAIETDRYYATTLEELKEEIVQKALDNEEIAEMSSSELREYIESEIADIGLEITDEERERTVNGIQREISDELRGNRERI